MSVKYVQLFFGVGIKRVNLKALNMYINLISDRLVGSLITGWTWWKWQNWRMKSTTEICTMETISTRPDMTVPAPLWIGITRSGSLPKTNYYYETYLQDIFSWYFHDLYILLDWSKKLSKYSVLSIDDINKYFWRSPSFTYVSMFIESLKKPFMNTSMLFPNAIQWNLLVFTSLASSMFL